MSVRLEFLAPIALLALACGTAEPPPDQPRADSLRIGLFNIRELSTAKILDVDEHGIGRDPQARAAATIVQRIRPDVLVLNEIDHDYPVTEAGLELNARRFASSYLASGDRAIEYPFVYAAPNNTGLLSGLDLNGDGSVATDADHGSREHGEDCYGFGTYPGQYSMAVLSRLPIDLAAARTFQRFLWRDLPDHHMPPGYYSEEVLEIFRLSSKSHWDLPIQVGSHTLHLLASHPTPQVFDGDEDRNGRRNFDEIGFWAHYLNGSEAIYDDEGRSGGGPADESFVVIGDLNAYPGAGSIYDGKASIAQLLDDPRISDSGKWLSSGRRLDEGTAGPPDFPERATATFGDGWRIDYILPSTDLAATGGGIFWPSPESDPEGHRLAEEASDHRLVWLDLEWSEP